MSICTTCHLVGPCNCDGTAPTSPRPRAAARPAAHRATTPARRPRALRPRPTRTDTPPAGGPCPLEHGDTTTPDMPDDRYVCRTCTGRLRGLLTNLDQTMADLDVALTGQVRFTAQRGGSRPDIPDPDDAHWPQTAATTRLPLALGAAEAGWVTRQTVLANLEWVLAVRGHDVPQTWSTVGTYLTAALDWLARHPEGPQVVDELTAGLRHARRAVDRPADQHYAGLCPGTLIDPDGLATVCAYPLYAADTAHQVTCPRCGAPWPVPDLRAALVRRIERHLLAAVDAERVLATVGIDVPARLIRLWKHRGDLDVAGHDPKGRPLYEVGAILARNALTSMVGETVTA